MARKYSDKLRQLAADNGLILVYHSVADANPSTLPSSVHNITPSVLARHIDQLQEFFTFIPLEAFAVAADKSGLAALTFDDGYHNVLSAAAPVLEHYGLHATLFLNAVTLSGRFNWRDKVRALIYHECIPEFCRFADLTCASERFYRHSKTPAINSFNLDCALDAFIAEHQLAIAAVYRDQPYLQWRQLQPNRPPFTYGNHSSNHYVLASLTREQQHQEITSGRQALARLEVSLSDCFAAPFGGTQDIDNRTPSIAGKAGYHNLLMSRQRLQPGHATRIDGVQILERFMPRSDDIGEELVHRATD